MDNENELYKLKHKCICKENKNRQLTETQQRSSKYKNEDLLSNMEQRTFISFSTDIVCIIAFIFFGSVIFWFAITKILLDCLKKTYHSERCIRIFVVGLLTVLLFSITTRVILNKMTWKQRISQEKVDLKKENVSVEDISAKLEVLPQNPEYLEVTFRDKKLRNLISKNKTDVNLQVPKKFTLTIVDERKKEVFKTSKNVLLPELTPEMKTPPTLIVSLKDIILENY